MFSFQFIFLERSMSFWMEERKWHPQHSQNSIYFQGGPTQINTVKQEKQTGCNNGTPLPEFYHKNLSQNPIPKCHICVLALCGSILNVSEMGARLKLHIPPNLSPPEIQGHYQILIPYCCGPPAQWLSPQSWLISQFFPPISVDALITMESHYKMLTPKSL